MRFTSVRGLPVPRVAPSGPASVPASGSRADGPGGGRRRRLWRARLGRSAGKLGHEVTLFERRSALGGALATVAAAGYAWDAGPSYTLLPAVIRDLFRKTGRPLERELDLVPLAWSGSTGSRTAPCSLPGGSRAAQLAAFETLGAGLGRQWAAYVDALAATGSCCGGLPGAAVAPRRPRPRELARLLAGREMLPRGSRGLRGRAAAARGRAPLRRRRSRPARRARLGRA